MIRLLLHNVIHLYYKTYVCVLCFDLYFMMAVIKIMASTSNSTPVDATGRDIATAYLGVSSILHEICTYTPGPALSFRY